MLHIGIKRAIARNAISIFIRKLKNRGGEVKMLYWVAAILEPTKKDRDELSKEEELVLQPKIVVAKDDKAAAIKVVMEADELKGKDMNRISIVVRPF